MPRTTSKEADLQRERLIRVERYRRDPLGFVTWAFPWGEPGPLRDHAGPEPWQADVLREIGRKLEAGESPVRVAVASGHGVGKSALVAWICLWASATVPSTRGVVTANTETQLRTKTWTELAKWQGLAATQDFAELGATSLASVLPVPEGAGRIDCVPWAAHNPEAFAGLHNKGSRVLLVFDEASAIAEPIWETAEGALTDSGTEIVWLAFGNPTRTSGRFHACFGRFRDRWHTKQIDSRRVSLTDGRQLDQWAKDYGEDSDFVRVRVRGLFPRAGTMQLIDGESVEDAMRRVPEGDRGRDGHHTAPLVMGVDVARFGDDKSVIVLRRGRDARSFAIEKHRGLDLMTLAGRVAEIAFAHGPAAVFVDETGLGAGVVDRLRQLGVLHVQGVNFGAAAARWDGDGAKSLYANKRAEMWGNLRDWIRGGGALPDDPDLRADLTGVEYGYTATGEIQLEKKEDMKKRGLASPDSGDALALTFAHPVRPDWLWDAPPRVRILDEDHEYDSFHDL
ncbi:MAG: terminase [Reyranella sp.]|nr:terminase [Reyranella sp.]